MANRLRGRCGVPAGVVEGTEDACSLGEGAEDVCSLVEGLGADETAAVGLGEISSVGEGGLVSGPGLEKYVKSA